MWRWLRRSPYGPVLKNPRMEVTGLVKDVVRDLAKGKKAMRTRYGKRKRRWPTKKKVYRRKVAKRSKYDFAFKALSKLMNAKLKTINTKLNSTLARHTRRTLDPSFLSVTSRRQQAYVHYDARSSTSDLEAAVGNLRFYDSNTNTIVTRSIASLSASVDIRIVSQMHALTCKNNYDIPCHVTIYACYPKSDTSLTPIVCYQNGLADQGNPPNTSQLLYPTDSNVFNELWGIKSKKSKILRAGEVLSLKYFSKPYTYNPSDIDAHADSFQKRYGAMSFMVFLKGVAAHNSTNIGTGDAGVDILIYSRRVFEYDAGIKLNDYSADDQTSNTVGTYNVSSLDVTKETYAV